MCKIKLTVTPTLIRLAMKNMSFAAACRTLILESIAQALKTCDAITEFV